MERGLSSQVMLAHPLSGIHSPLSTLSIELFPQPTGIDSGYVPGLEANKNQATKRHPGQLFFFSPSYKPESPRTRMFFPLNSFMFSPACITKYNQSINQLIININQWLYTPSYPWPSISAVDWWGGAMERFFSSSPTSLSGATVSGVSTWLLLYIYRQNTYYNMP